MISRMKELEDENRRLKKMYLEEKLKAEIVAETLEKSGEAISQKEDGQNGSGQVWRLHTGGVRRIWYPPVVLPLRAHAGRRER